MKLIAQNKKAFHDYDIQEKLEAGIVLTGDEVKSIRSGKVSMKGSYATIHDGEFYMINCHISPYDKAFSKGDEQFATRRRKLLVHKRELDRLIGDISRKGVTAIPLRMYFSSKGKVKVEIGIGKHKKATGKKQALKERDLDRQTRRELKDY